MDQTQTHPQEKIQEKNADLDAQFFTMPEAYRQGKEAKLVEPKSLAPAHATTPLPTPLPPVVPLTAKPPLNQNSVSTTTKALSIAGIVVFLSLVIGGILIWKSQSSTDLPQKPSAEVNLQPSTPS